MNKTGIEYLTHSWNPIAMRCTPISEGCENCWHLAMCKRHAANETLTTEVRAAKAGGPSVLLEGELGAPSRLRKPARIGLQFMGDLFHSSICDEWIDQVMARIGLAGQHTFIMLTKRADRMAEYFAGGGAVSTWGDIAKEIVGEPVRADFPDNLYLGVSVENQKAADERIPKLMETPAAVRIISAEPLLGPTDLADAASDWWESAFQPWWLIIGCESGPNRRPCWLEWVKSLVDQADSAAIPVFIKQLEINGKVTSNPADWPEWARRREFPVTYDRQRRSE